MLTLAIIGLIITATVGLSVVSGVIVGTVAARPRYRREEQ